MSTTCQFCSRDEKPVRENDLAKVYISDPHKVPGHVLVMPKRHIEKPWELTAEELQACFDLIFLIEKRFLGKLGDGFDIRQSYWPFREPNSLKAKHILFHVIPRSEGDYLFKIAEGQNPEDLYADLDDVEGDAVARLLR
ncbi:MAG TPA: HIT domain-containing protein [Candidatus Saccharimonadales bacterium]|nr:HIT domain-containing protein [Candidatus Saccharimonadales bacterium]